MVPGSEKYSAKRVNFLLGGGGRGAGYKKPEPEMGYGNLLVTYRQNEQTATSGFTVDSETQL